MRGASLELVNIAGHTPLMVSIDFFNYLPLLSSTYFFFRPHRLHPVNKMRPVATDVSRSVVCLFVCLCVHWSQGCAMQKCLNWLRCYLGADLGGTMY